MANLCAICHENLDCHQELRYLPCCHCFHAECLEGFGQARRKPVEALPCPTCQIIPRKALEEAEQFWSYGRSGASAVHRLLSNGFKPAPFPAWLADVRAEMVQRYQLHIVPLAREECCWPKKPQTNPLYTEPPGGKGKQSCHNCKEPLRAMRFGVGALNDATFLFAEVEWKGKLQYINVHHQSATRRSKPQETRCRW